MTDKPQLNNVYMAGMTFAMQLRLSGFHDLAHYIEVMALRVQKEIENDDVKTKA